MRTYPREQAKWLPWLYALSLLPAIGLLLGTLWSAVHERRLLASHTRQLELQRLQWHAWRQAEGLAALRDVSAGHAATATSWTNDTATRRYWNHLRTEPRQFLYSAVVDRSGEILLHTDPGQIDQHLVRGWYDKRLAEFGEEFTWSHSSPLARGRPAYDVSVALGEALANGDRLHAGLDATWLDAQVARQQHTSLLRWGGILVLVSAVNLSAGWALYTLFGRCRQLEATGADQVQRRKRELAQIGAGLAHEVRNPLHALRINLHTLRRILLGKSSLPPEQVVDTLNESDSSINRLDELMRDLVLFASPTASQAAQVDLVQEVQATLRLLGEELKRDQIVVRESLPVVPAPIAVDPARLRQSLLNLLTFAQHRSGRSGTIEVAVTRVRQGIELLVSDSGPAIASEQRRLLFDPFQATAETGSGLGLALVQSLAEDTGGQVSCESEVGRNATEQSDARHAESRLTGAESDVEMGHGEAKDPDESHGNRTSSGLRDGMIKNCCRVWFPIAQAAEGG